MEEAYARLGWAGCQVVIELTLSKRLLDSDRWLSNNFFLAIDSVTYRGSRPDVARNDSQTWGSN
jgi:hypothetical protein